MQRLGQKIRTLREQRGMTLMQMAVALGYPTHRHSYLSEIETGKRTPKGDFILKVADLFGVTTDQLMRDELDLP
jgi:transcriptional regulator with XRE-family HTH domain